MLHDAEDLVHRGELRVFDRLIERFAVVQLPVLPLIDGESRWVSAHYADEFIEAHVKQMVVREAIGAGLPLAGVGCAIAREMLGRIAQANGGVPFDPGSLTEDYEMGLHIAALGGRGIIARVPETAGGPPVAVRALFPATLEAAINQKARWITGIALAGWDRVGWGPVRGWREHWMRMRDRRALLAVIVLAAGYVSLIGWSAVTLIYLVTGAERAPLSPLLVAMLRANAGLLAWRLMLRAALVGRTYGWREGLRSMPRTLVANIIAILAVGRALVRYWRMIRGAPLVWGKTVHAFPDRHA